MKVGYIFFHGLGDNIFTLEPLFALKKIFNCEVVVFGNAIMQNLLRYCDFVDVVHNIDSDIANHIATINMYNLDYVILVNCKRCYLRPLEQTNAKVIITTMKIPSLFSWRCKTIPLHFLPKYRRMPRYKQALCFIRKINPKIFDSKIKTLCLDDAKVQTTLAQKAQVKSLINNHMQSCRERESNNPIFVLINPFSHTARYTLPIEAFLELILLVGKIPNCIPTIVTYPQIHANFIESLTHWQHAKNLTISNLIIFQNDNDILNLAAFIEQMHYVISPSTGTIHLASNLCIPTIGLFSQYDTIKWGTKSKQYVILPKPKTAMTAEDINKAIIQTIELLQTNIAQSITKH